MVLSICTLFSMVKVKVHTYPFLCIQFIFPRFLISMNRPTHHQLKVIKLIKVRIVAQRSWLHISYVTSTSKDSRKFVGYIAECDFFFYGFFYLQHHCAFAASVVKEFRMWWEEPYSLAQRIDRRVYCSILYCKPLFFISLRA